MKKTLITCDICNNPASFPDEKMQVIFLTEQDEGGQTDPYFDNEKIDMCATCMDLALNGNYIFAKGAQGYNKFSFQTTFQSITKQGEDIVSKKYTIDQLLDIIPPYPFADTEYKRFKGLQTDLPSRLEWLEKGYNLCINELLKLTKKGSDLQVESLKGDTP